MNKEVKAKWLAALRSGEYEQGKEALRPSGNTYCCLGVLCDIYAKDHPGIGWKVNPNPKVEHAMYSFLSYEDILPSPVRDWAELPDDNPYLKVVEEDEFGSEREEEKEIAVLNDSEVSFEEIADLIEEQL